MKKSMLFTLMALFAVGFATSSCDKVDEKGNALENAYTYDGQKFDIAWAGYYEDTYEDEGVIYHDGYCFGVSPVVPGELLFDQPNFFEVNIPVEKLGQKCDLNQNCDGENWILYGAFAFNGDDVQSFYDDSYGLTGDNNWVKISKLEGENNFSMEFALTLSDGKRLEGSYGGVFEKKPEYENVGNYL